MGKIIDGNFTNRLTTEEFITKAKLIHGDKYDYSKVDYKYSNENVIITCKVHGDFLQRPGNHINSKQGCSKCAGNINKSSQEFIEEAIKIHGDKYDYSKVDYKCANAKIIITCKIHGDFEQKPYCHLNGNGCYMCCKNHKLNTIEFIEKANLSGAKSVDVGQDYAVFELTGTSKELKKIENLMKPFGIIEMIRGGRIAIQSNL